VDWKGLSFERGRGLWPSCQVTIRGGSEQVTKKKSLPSKKPNIYGSRDTNAARRGDYYDAHFLNWWRETLPGSLQSSSSEELKMLIEDCAADVNGNFPVRRVCAPPEL
jgi:hypothetical protein